MHPYSILPSWIKSRGSGVLLHVTSLPGEFGIGNLGQVSHDFIDFLHDSGFRFWQICPVGPTGYGDSPYQVFSSAAGNPYLIDWQALIDTGVIIREDVSALISNPDQKNIKVGKAGRSRWLGRRPHTRGCLLYTSPSPRDS